MQKMTFTTAQNAFDYAVYMMLGSCFDKTVCKNSIMEHKLLLQFKEQRRDNQYLMEELADGFMKRKLIPLLSEDALHTEARMSFGHDQFGDTFISAQTDDIQIFISTAYSGGRKAGVRCKYICGKDRPVIMKCTVVHSGKRGKKSHADKTDGACSA